MSDEEIRKLLLRKEEAGLEALIDQYGGLLRSVIKKYLYALPSYVDECLNDVLLSIWDNAKQYNPDKASFKNWICAIARYRAISYLRKYQREINQFSWIEQLERNEFTVDEPFHKELWEQELAELLAPLSPKEKQLFVDVFDSAFSNEEVANRYQITTSALYNRVSRIRKKLKNSFKKGV